MGRRQAKRHRATIRREIRPDEISDTTMERLMTFSEQLIHQLNAIHKHQNPPADEKVTDEVKKGFYV